MGVGCYLVGRMYSTGSYHHTKDVAGRVVVFQFEKQYLISIFELMSISF